MNQKQVALQTVALVEGVKEAFRLGGQDMHPYRIAVVVEGVLGSGPAVVGVLSFAVPGLHVPVPDTIRLLLDGLGFLACGHAGQAERPGAPGAEEDG